MNVAHPACASAVAGGSLAGELPACQALAGLAPWEIAGCAGYPRRLIGNISGGAPEPWARTENPH